MTGSLPSTAPSSVDAAAQVFVDDLAAPMVGDDDAHHLVDVLRLRPGEPVIAADGHGAWCRCRIAARDRRASGLLEVDGPVVVSPRPDPPVTVAFAPVKGDRPEWVVQKLTELGVDTILPLRTLRSVVRWDGERQARSIERLRRVAREAASQSRRAWLPVVADVVAVPELGGAALAEPGGGALTLAHPVVAIGPEGGWDPSELEQAAATVGLGDTVLRAETAAVTAGALLCGLRAGTVRPAI
ncbi:MAG: RsmE family RNA methyltransferase [Actinomycetota bacterium]|nr:RsmE family RNA methyltransferase [Actinomycetota bacterium]